MTDLYVPPKPAIPARDLSIGEFLRAARTNALTMWSEPAYDDWSRTGRFFGRTSLLLNDPAAIHRVLVDNADAYRRSPATIRVLRPLIGKGLFLAEGEDWRLQRRTTAPALSPRVLPMLARHIVAVANEVVAGLRPQADAPIELLGTVQRTALEIAGRSMFSLETRAFGVRLREMLAEFGMRHGRVDLPDILLPPAIPTLGDLGRMMFRSRWKRLMDEIMKAREKAAPVAEGRDLFDLLRAARDPETGRGFTREQLRDQVATMILAGHETTGITIFWALTLLARVSEAQARVAEEVRGVDLAAAVGGGHIPDLPYTRAVVNETLRLYPPAFALSRVANGNDRGGDIAIPRGAIVMIAPWVLQRHRRLWRDPDAFDPSRFMPGAPAPPRFAYLPFGAGPRVCVGAQFALVEATLVLAAIVQTFEIAIEGSRPVLPFAVVTIQPNHSPVFRLRLRSQPGAASCPSLTPSVAPIPS